MITAIKAYALLSLLCSAAYPVWGYALNRRKEADLSPLPEIIRAKELIL